MKVTLNQNEFVNRFLAVRPKQFSFPALVALFDFLDQEEQDLGEEQELDVIAICCEWQEYASAVEAAEAFGWEDPTPEGGERDSTAERAALEYLQDETAVIELSSGVLVRDF
jgi:hypothetical protein